VSVLLDAGAGTHWSYKSKENGRLYRRSEGLAVASLEMFKAGMFSSDSSQPYQVDAEGLKRLTVEAMGKALQVSEQNSINGLEGRANLLIRLSGALGNREFFGVDARPGNMLGMFISCLTVLFGVVADSKSANKSNAVQITLSPIQQHRHPLYRLFRYPPYGMS
jgi:hypothetical protein